MNLEQLMAGYRLMLRSRAIDDACSELLEDGAAVPNYHGARGQEALYAGVGVALNPSDYLLYNYRAFATLLAKGVSLEELLGDLLMRTSGTSKGHGGIMHVTAPERGIVGRNGVFGSKFGIALGLAQEIVLRKRYATVVCMFGEAEGNRGGLYEALNLASLRNLPIIFVAENNGYAVAAETKHLYATGDMSGCFRGMPMPVLKADGNDLGLVASEMAALCARARDGAGPALVEFVTYRLDPHHANDDDSRYRDADALADAWAKEPIGLAEHSLLERGIGRSELDAERRAAIDEVGAAVKSALEAGRAELAEVYRHVYFKDLGAAAS